jgi:hypothetical protein
VHGVLWPLRFATAGGSGLVGAAPPPAWALTGLDVNRGYPPEALRQWPWDGRAAAPAVRLHDD